MDVVARGIGSLYLVGRIMLGITADLDKFKLVEVRTGGKLVVLFVASNSIFGHLQKDVLFLFTAGRLLVVVRV